MKITKRIDFSKDPKWQKEQEGKVVIMHLRRFLHELRVIRFTESSFDSNVFIKKYKV